MPEGELATYLVGPGEPWSLKSWRGGAVRHTTSEATSNLSRTKAFHQHQALLFSFKGNRIDSRRWSWCSVYCINTGNKSGRIRPSSVGRLGRLQAENKNLEPQLLVPLTGALGQLYNSSTDASPPNGNNENWMREGKLAVAGSAHSAVAYRDDKVLGFSAARYASRGRQRSLVPKL